MATTTPNFGWPVPTSSDLVKNGATAIEGLGDAIDASLLDLKGGTSGQVLAKASGTDMDFSWVTDATGIPATIFDAKGDIIAATAADTASRLAVGANNTVLTADSSTATGLKWATPAGGGKVLQVIQATTGTTVDNSTSTYADTGLTVNITPSSASSKVLIMITVQGVYKGSNADSGVAFKILRDATQVMVSANNFFTRTTTENMAGWSVIWLDSPSSTSSITYKAQFKNLPNAALARVQDAGTSSIVVMEIGA